MIFQVPKATPLLRFGAVLGLLLALVALPASGVAQSTHSIPPYTASYEASAMGNTLKARITLNHEDVQTRMAMDAHVSGFLRILGRFELSREALMNRQNGELQLVHSRSRQITPRRDRKVETRFDWERGLAIGTINSDSFQLEVPDRTLDFLGSLYLMMQRLESGELSAVGDRKTIQALERDRLREYRFEVAARETMESPIGRVDTIRVDRHTDDSDVALSAWFARELRHVPVRLDYEADGRVFELNLTQLEWHDPIIDLTE
ncbi:DUF3108 domain-containing protein [Thioalkalivibrio sp. ALJ16]|uniref:DUF3108 domain-containing protein n=1 Tax=Thioalkalivibrio sp. ALJ16 TaxID=1158762 RepID=UPI0003666F50|nr:DUF3108 domain-containing protein [Thioalkalivibrio sp. ALJ16]